MTTAVVTHQGIERVRFAKHALTAIGGSLWSGAARALSRRARARAKAPTREQVIRDANHLREMARRLGTSQPGLASDFYAAAAHHEQVHGY